MFMLDIETTNAIFENRAQYEIANILEEIADKLRQGNHNGSCLDENGNTVGSFELHL